MKRRCLQIRLGNDFNERAQVHRRFIPEYFCQRGNYILVPCTRITHSELHVGIVVFKHGPQFKFQSPLEVRLRSFLPRWSSLHLKTTFISQWLYFALLKGHPFPSSGRKPLSYPLPKDGSALPNDN